MTSPTRTPLRLISWPPPPPAGRDESTDGPTGHLHAARFCELLAPRPRNRSPDDTPNAEFISARQHGTTKSCLIYYEESNARRPAPSHDRMSCELAMSWTAARAGVVWYWRLHAQLREYIISAFNSFRAQSACSPLQVRACFAFACTSA